jgi:hypothetical protein
MTIDITATDETRAHYANPIVTETILRVSEIAGARRWAVGDSKGWYRYFNNEKLANDMSAENYKRLTNDHRTLYGTLSYFSPITYQTDYSRVIGDKAKIFSRSQVKAITFGIDIDSKDPKNGHGANIHDPDVKKAVEAMATFFVEELKTVIPNSLNVLYSGGGIYVMVHHAVLQGFFDDMSCTEGFADSMLNMTDGLNILIDDLSAKFYKESPDCEKYVKADAIVNSKRVFKTIFSVHKKYNYAVIPIDINKIVIDFKKAELPLSTDVIESGRNYYTKHDDGDAFIEFIMPYYTKAKVKNSGKQYNEPVMISEGKFSQCDFPPCVLNLMNRGGVGAGATRALAFLAAFFGQVNVSEGEARGLWSRCALNWGAETANVFESWYRNMNCPSCKTLRTAGSGYPRIDIAGLGACQPDMRCHKMNCTNPVCYTDKKQYLAKLKRDLFGISQVYSAAEEIKSNSAHEDELSDIFAEAMR